MTIRDRGILKWQTSFILPEHSSALQDLKKDYFREKKPLIDEYEAEEFERLICYAMEYQLAVKIKIWNDGFTHEEKGFVHYLDPLKKQVRLKTEDDIVVRFNFVDIIGVDVLE
ncbi:YolD-like family protein [Bacillus sp. T33-2]|uniref:YolD-like family protein n=1 Tax=Bacillus sp. T33-2 TaxID=2054168 RepID=UPI000C76E837|nr:YolD-like family protein [Bacillus sp. T33-2]PLR89762.1 YolD-like family protein [Bacillus sp. T33-2]